MRRPGFSCVNTTDATTGATALFREKKQLHTSQVQQGLHPSMNRSRDLNDAFHGWCELLMNRARAIHLLWRSNQAL